MNSEQILIVDGYNMIGAWPIPRKLAEQSLEDARDIIIEWLADYQGYSGMKIILVFDAHQVPGVGGKYKQYHLEIIYSKEKETADECIERLVSSLVRPRRQVFVATSDQTEQHVIFGKGAYRKPARELMNDIIESQQEISRKMARHHNHIERNTIDGKMSEEMQRLFERWRRGN